MGYALLGLAVPRLRDRGTDRDGLALFARQSPEQVPVPDVAGLTVDGRTHGPDQRPARGPRREPKPSDTVPEGQIIDQSPASGHQGRRPGRRSPSTCRPAPDAAAYRPWSGSPDEARQAAEPGAGLEPAGPIRSASDETRSRQGNVLGTDPEGETVPRPAARSTLKVRHRQEQGARRRRQERGGGPGHPASRPVSPRRPAGRTTAKATEGTVLGQTPAPATWRLGSTVTIKVAGAPRPRRRRRPSRSPSADDPTDLDDDRADRAHRALRGGRAADDLDDASLRTLRPPA